MHRQLSKAVLLAATMLATGPALAQGANPAQPAPTAPTAQTPRPSPAAAEFVMNAAMTDMLEIQSSQLANTKSQNAQVKQFAQRMIQDHTASSDKLKAAAQGITIPAGLDAEHARMLQQLQSAPASDFDRTYADLQVTGHQGAVTLFDQYAQNGDNAQLKQFAQQTLPTIRDHLQMATQLRAALNPPSPVASAQTPGAQPATGQNPADAQNAANTLAGGQIVVQQPAPAIRVDQPPAQVTVQQGQPNVTVRQPQPEIIVQQPAPTITVDIPPPQITVRMPKPEVNVAQAQPQVQVTQPPPNVQVIQPTQQPQVSVQPVQPQVNLAQGQAPPSIDVQQLGQPIVRYERAEPQVKITQQQGQPTIKFEQLDQTAANTPNAATPQATQNQQTASAANPTASTPSAAPSAAVQNQPTATAGGSQLQTRQVAVNDLRGADVVNQNNDKLGTVDHVVMNTTDNQPYIVLSQGGFLGLGEKKVVVPLVSLRMDGKRLVSDLSDSQIKQMPEWKSDTTAFRDVPAGQTTQVRTQ
jgi:predicted outer membrane protein